MFFARSLCRKDYGWPLLQRQEKGGGGGQGSTGQNSPGMGHAARSTGLRGKEAMVDSWPSTLLRRCQLVGLSARVDLEELSGLLVGF